MANHARKDIRDAVSALLTGQITYGGKAVGVHMSRSLPWFRVSLPAIGIYMHEEDAEDRDSAPREYYRDLKLVIEILAEELLSVPTDDIFDAIILQVEEILFLNPYLTVATVDKADDTKYVKMEVTQTKNGERIISSMVTFWNIEYRTFAPIAQTLASFDTATTSIDNAIDGAYGPAKIQAEQDLT